MVPIEIKGKYTTAIVLIDTIDETTSSQIHTIVSNPAFTNPIYIMPDTHAGKGSVIGFTMKMPDKIIPNIVGVDINCGMLTFKINDKITNIIPNINEVIDRQIRKAIPFGTNVHANYKYKIGKFPWKAITEQGRLFTMAFNKRYNTSFDTPIYGVNWFGDKCKEIGMSTIRAIKSIGTLGGGNHFIEIGKCELGQTWATIHSGSRQFGSKIASYWQKVAARNHMKRNHYGMSTKVDAIKKTYPKSLWQSEITKARGKHKFVAKGLEYLEGKDMFNYLIDMVFTQAYADENRKTMKELMSDIISVEEGSEISCSHNYINFKDFIIRKGAISAYKDEIMIIPFNMEDGTLICKGKGNADWNYSAPHGAGRLMSRAEAKRKAKEKGTLQKAKARMEKSGVFASKLPADELKESYKDPKIIEEAIEPTATIIHRIKPIIAIKE